MLLKGDCLELLRLFPSDRVDSCVTDPPYGLEFMGKEWDGADGFRRSLNKADVGRDNAFGRLSRKGPEYRAGHLYQEWCEAWAREVYRVLKPGAFLLAFGGTRTYHRLACAIEDAGFEVRDMVAWLYGQGFPKSVNIGDGKGTALKPAQEPICMARKPLSEGTIAANVLKWGTGAINVDGCRVAINPEIDDPRLGGNGTWETGKMAKNVYEGGYAGKQVSSSPLGRFPANVIHDGSDEVLVAFPQARGQIARSRRDGSEENNNVYGALKRDGLVIEPRDQGGSAARFFYCAKTNKQERANSKHPTVKPINLMRYLCRLVTPPNGVVIDPFAGTGTTGEAAILEGFRPVLIEREAEYQTDIERRLSSLDRPSAVCTI